MAPRVLVSGLGSIGKRHLENLQTLSVADLAIADPDEGRRKTASELGVRTFTDLATALAGFEPQVVVICTPPSMHVEQALASVRAGAHVLIEKPLSDSLEGVAALAREAAARNRVVRVGYNLRFHPGILLARELLPTIGRALWARAEVGQYLPDWRPAQDYRTNYSARRSLGGGIVLDASHEIDYALWLFGRPDAIVAMTDRMSELDVDVEDVATLLLRVPAGPRVDIHMDFIQRAGSRSLKVAGSAGTLEWDNVASLVRVYRAETGKWEEHPYAYQANDMYLAEMRAFLALVEDGSEVPLATLDEGIAALKVALAAYDSERTARRVVIDWS